MPYLEYFHCNTDAIFKGIDPTYYNLHSLIRFFIDLDVYIAGGAAISLIDESIPHGDLDVYVNTPMKVVEIIKWIEDHKCYAMEHKTTNSISFNIGSQTLQVITNPKFLITEDISATIRRFDFRACMCAFSFKKGMVFSVEGATQDIKYRRLEFNPHCISNYLTLMPRMYKYLKKGFGIDYTQLMSMYLYFTEKSTQYLNGETTDWETEKVTKHLRYFKNAIANIHHVLSMGSLNGDGNFLHTIEPECLMGVDWYK